MSSPIEKALTTASLVEHLGEGAVALVDVEVVAFERKSLGDVDVRPGPSRFTSPTTTPRPNAISGL